MMPIMDTSPAHHHHHGHGHHSFYHQQHVPEPIGKMQLTLILPNGVPSVISVDANTPMMDLLVQAASTNKLNPSGYSLVVLDSNQHVIQFKANQTVGQIGSSTISLLPKETSHVASSSKTKGQPFEITVRLQVNLPDAQKILLRVDPTLPLHEIKEQICKQKKYIDSNRFTLRLPNKLDEPLLLGLSLAEYKTNELSLVHLKPNGPRLGGNQLQSFDRLYRARSESQPAKETIQEEQQREQEQQSSVNPKQRPMSAQPNAARSPTPSKQQNVAHSALRASHQITSHTSLHAYWNDPNFDTQSQTSNCSSTTKKRRAPRPPGYISPVPSPTGVEPQIVYVPQYFPHQIGHSPSNGVGDIYSHDQSHESLTDNNNNNDQQLLGDHESNGKRKRKAPVVAITTSPTSDKEKDDAQNRATPPEQQQNVTSSTTRPGLHPPPPPPPPLTTTASPSGDSLSLTEDFRSTIEIGQKVVDDQGDKSKIESTMHSTDGQRVQNLLTQQQTPTTASSPDQTVAEQRSTPIYSQIQKHKELESAYSTVDTTPTPQHQNEIEQKTIDAVPITPTIYSVSEIIQAGIAEPPVEKSSRSSTNKDVTIVTSTIKSPKSNKKSTSIDGLVRIIDDHHERAKVYRASPAFEKEKQNVPETNEGVSYFRVAKSRCGKFETDSRGFVNTSVGVFNSAAQQQQQSGKTSSSSETASRTVQQPQQQQQQKIIPVVVHQPTKGKQAYDLLKKYEKEEDNEQSQSATVPIDTEYLKSTTDRTVVPSLTTDQEKSPTPIQLEVTERTTHIKVTVESDRKQLITRASPVPQQSESSTSGAAPPPILAPKPFGKTITEYRTVRRVGNGPGETTTTTTTTIRTGAETPTVTTINNTDKRSTSIESDDDRGNSNDVPSHESLMDSIRRFGGSQNLSKK